MENLILEFDQELNNVIKMKENEARWKLEEEMMKYQEQLNMLREGETERRYEIKSEANDRSMRQNSLLDYDSFDYELIMQKLSDT